MKRAPVIIDGDDVLPASPAKEYEISPVRGYGKSTHMEIIRLAYIRLNPGATTAVIRRGSIIVEKPVEEQ